MGKSVVVSIFGKYNIKHTHTEWKKQYLEMTLR